jgi:hypothetical protein
MDAEIIGGGGGGGGRGVVRRVGWVFGGERNRKNSTDGTRANGRMVR